MKLKGIRVTAADLDDEAVEARIKALVTKMAAEPRKMRWATIEELQAHGLLTKAFNPGRKADT